MPFNDTVERAFDVGRDDLGAFLRLAYQSFLDEGGLAKPESPIEHALAIAMISLSIATPLFEFMDAKLGSPIAKRRGVTRKRAIVLCQEPVGRFRVDFLIHVLLENEPVGTIVVECDGHDFHERTKSQAAKDRSRDREMTNAGHKVLRFTGSEIYRQPMACAWDIVSAVDLVIEEAAKRK